MSFTWPKVRTEISPGAPSPTLGRSDWLTASTRVSWDRLQKKEASPSWPRLPPVSCAFPLLSRAAFYCRAQSLNR